MNTLLFLVSIFSAPDTQAYEYICPQLAGSYACVAAEDGRKGSLQIRQRETNGITSYQMGDTGWFKAEPGRGFSRDFPNATCRDGSLLQFISGSTFTFTREGDELLVYFLLRSDAENKLKFRCTKVNSGGEDEE